MAVSMIPNILFELLLHAAFVADEIWGFMLESALYIIQYSEVLRCMYFSDSSRGNSLFFKKGFHHGREIRTHDQRPMVDEAIS